MNTSDWVWMNHSIWLAIIAPPKASVAPVPFRRKLGTTNVRLITVMPIARVQNIAIGAATSVHTPHPL